MIDLILSEILSERIGLDIHQNTVTLNENERADLLIVPFLISLDEIGDLLIIDLGRKDDMIETQPLQKLIGIGIETVERIICDLFLIRLKQSAEFGNDSLVCT